MLEWPHSQTEIETPAGTVTVIAPAAILNGEKPELRPIVRLGENTSAIRTEFVSPTLR